MYAAMNGHQEICEMLLNHGADVNEKDNNGEFKNFRSIWLLPICYWEFAKWFRFKAVQRTIHRGMLIIAFPITRGHPLTSFNKN